MIKSRLQDIKQAQKESLLQRELASFFVRIAQDNPDLQTLSVSRVNLTHKKSVVTVFFSCLNDKEEFDKLLPKLILFKPSIRSSLAKSLNQRYTQNIVFVYDSELEQRRGVEELIDKLKDEGKL